ncbi:GNAT family N-acetyltransferase [Rossellomorea sp. SC111]|uniref:GNAT family N-acetyltransferase n=1 Tax=Rossellomorea sp. SC111 TaxID=2968985 RepID=UPI00215B3530|nr:GNAT family N-acetyltransferase [Rossellomorea sp. SC111]MCR8849797.1 GNAT family N-acetyltransferase [Rossellomorea sp. SC111]
MGIIEINRVSEFDINKDIHQPLQQLLCECFGKDYPEDRIYFKQKPHLRFLAYVEERLVGHIACDYRVMNLNGRRINVLSLIDVCVSAANRSRGIASQLLKEAEGFCRNRDIDYILLFADHPNVYERNGYKKVQNRCKWLKIDDETQTSAGIGYEVINELMVKAVSEKGWEEGELDLLGYLG